MAMKTRRFNWHDFTVWAVCIIAFVLSLYVALAVKTN